MDIASLLPHIPIAAFVLLVIVGLFIGFEIYILVQSKIPKKQKASESEQNPDTMQPLKFPEITNPKINIKSSSHNALSKKTIFVLISTIIILGGLGAGYYYLNSSGLLSNLPFINPDYAVPITTPAPDSISPTGEPAVFGAKIVLYLETSENKWQPLAEEDLSTLKTDDVIRIAIKTDRPANRIEITVNEIPVYISPGQSPEGHPYARYIIPRDEFEYKVAATIY